MTDSQKIIKDFAHINLHKHLPNFENKSRIGTIKFNYYIMLCGLLSIFENVR